MPLRKLALILLILIKNVGFSAMRAVSPEESVVQRLESPCPNILTVNPTSINIDNWSGTMKLNLDKDIMGLFVQIEMDSRINLITNNLGVMTSTDNKKYLMEDFYYEPNENQQDLVMDFTVKYNGVNPTPQIKNIFINGELKCPDLKNQNGGHNLPPTTTTTTTTYKPVPTFDIDDD